MRSQHLLMSNLDPLNLVRLFSIRIFFAISLLAFSLQIRASQSDALIFSINQNLFSEQKIKSLAEAMGSFSCVYSSAKLFKLYPFPMLTWQNYKDKSLIDLKNNKMLLEKDFLQYLKKLASFSEMLKNEKVNFSANLFPAIKKSATLHSCDQRSLINGSEFANDFKEILRLEIFLLDTKEEIVKRYNGVIDSNKIEDEFWKEVNSYIAHMESKLEYIQYWQ